MPKHRPLTQPLALTDAELDRAADRILYCHGAFGHGDRPFYPEPYLSRLSAADVEIGADLGFAVLAARAARGRLGVRV